MPYITYDTSVIISRKLTDLPDNFLLSAVVFLELMASASDDSRRKYYEALYREYKRYNSMIVPSGDDWLLASRILYWLAHGRRKKARGRAPKLKPGAAQRMALDTLIAASARRWKAALVTENWDDFKAIQYYCDFKLIKGSDFFK